MVSPSGSVPVGPTVRFNFRRLKLCSERFGEHFQAFHELAACLICANRVEQLDAVS